MELDYHELQGTDMVLYADSSQDMVDVEQYNNHSASTGNDLSTFSADTDNLKELHECLLSNAESLEESEKLAFICSCVLDSVKAGGSVLIPLNRLGIVLQLLEQIPIYLESSAVTAPIFFISSVATELLTFANIIPEWLCKPWQEKSMADFCTNISGEPLFSHVEQMKCKKLLVFPAVHSPDAINNWQELCMTFALHWSLRLGPLVPLIQRWHEDHNSLLVLEDGLDADMALLPFKPISMKVLNCSFLSGLRTQKIQPLLKILQPKVVMLPEHLKHHINATTTGSNSFSVSYYTENVTLDLRSLKGGLDIQIATELATRLAWRKSKKANMDVARLEGQLFVNDGKYWIRSGNETLDSKCGSCIYRGLLDIEKLFLALSNAGINGSKEQSKEIESEGYIGIIRIHDASVEVLATSTIVSALDENLAARISLVICTLLDGI